jgi:hypothetical protein
VIITINYTSFQSKLNQEKCSKSKSLFLCKKKTLGVGLSILFLVFLVGLCINTANAQPSMSKTAIIFRAVWVWESHDFWDCADWDLEALLFYPTGYSLGYTIVLDYCVDEGKKYDVIPTVAIVTENPSDQKPLLTVGGYEGDHVGGTRLGTMVVEIPPPLSISFPGTGVGYSYASFGLTSFSFNGYPFSNSPDYVIYFDTVDCHSKFWFNAEPCTLPPGAYYRWWNQGYYIRGIPPDPDLEPCVFC